jgi:hypothetical protein
MNAMAAVSTNARRQRSKPDAVEPTRLQCLIEQAIASAHDESEAASGFFAVLENELELPFATRILGIEVQVETIDMTEADDIVAVCRCGKNRQRVLLAELPLPDPRPTGAQWIDAYRQWVNG